MILRTGSALLALTLSTSCDPSCIDVLCSSFASASFALSGGQRPPVEGLELQIDGRVVVCEPSEIPDLFSCDDALVGFGLQEDATCTERVIGEAVSVDCVGNGRFSWVADIVGSPRSVTFQLRGAEGTQTIPWQPTYVSTFGEALCEGECLEAIDRFIVEPF